MTESDVIICGHGSGTPSTKNMASYLASRYNQIAPNGKHKGVVSVKRLKQLSDADRPRFTAKYSEILGRNIYSQNLRQYVYTPYGGKYYSDCSSSICATYQQIGMSVSLLNTAGIFESSLFESVPVAISAGHILNPDVLRVGDCLLFVGDNPKRPKQIGHVEAVYKIPSEMPSYKISGTVTVTASELNVRTRPDINAAIVKTYPRGALVTVSEKSGEWFKTVDGWISRKWVRGWIKEPQDDPFKNYWYIDNGSYPVDCIADIGGNQYAFDRDGWMIESQRISTSGAIIY